MQTRVKGEGRIVGGVLDTTYERSYYTLIPCPKHGDQVGLSDHRGCENFAGLRLDPDTGSYFVYCCRERP